jgi:predicted transcriptional regulator
MWDLAQNWFMIYAAGLWFVVRYRCRLDILAAVLNASSDGAKKTRIMRAANLSYNVLRKYLDETVGVGFLQLNNGSHETTGKGRRFLEMCPRFSSKHVNLRKQIEVSELDLKGLEDFVTPTNNNA